MGETAEDVLSSTDITAEEKQTYASVIAKFDSFFKVRKNVIFEGARFNSRCQKDGESVEQFITSLYQLVEDCEYGALKDQMVRDRLVVGLRDLALSQRLQMDPDLTLEKAKTLSRQQEAVKEQQGLLHKSSPPPEDSSIAFLSRGKGQVHRPAGRARAKTNDHRARFKGKCTRCGKGPHSRQQCPANLVECHRCKKKGHFSSQCFTKTVAVVGELPSTTDLDDMDDVAYLNTIDSDQGNAWTCHINVNGHDVSFKIDTGAEVTVISDNITKSIGLHQLHPPSKNLHGPDNRPLEVIGEATARLVYKGTECTQPIFVVRNVKQNLLGFPAIQALQILKDVNAVTQSIPEQLPTLFTGLGTLKGEPYEIRLKPEAQPFALYTPRNVPLPLRQKVKEELSRMQSLGVISPVGEPTPWCAGMVVVPKKSGAVRICVGFRPLNNNVLREVHPLPKVDENLAQLAGAQMFSKLDANCGFWQIPLSEQ